MKNEAKPRVYDILAKAFAQEDVRTCFALLGDANMNWAARLSEGGCRMVYVSRQVPASGRLRLSSNVSSHMTRALGALAFAPFVAAELRR